MCSPCGAVMLGARLRHATTRRRRSHPTPTPKAIPPWPSNM
ncbi:hypothetical protein M3J09_007798 [Ascochyta lentis]